jgi:putative redox protein
MAESRRAIIARIHARTGSENYRTAVQAGAHQLTADEPAARGGADAGPAPYDLVLAGLAACTAITLRMVAERKGWALRGIDVDVKLVREGEASHIERTLLLEGELDADQRARLLEISEKTPVTLTVKTGVEIRTSLR